jgi:hypothetical protein
MTPEEIVQALESRGWKAEIVKRENVAGLVEVNSEGLMKCVDGRASDHAGMRGPKTLGGLYAIASLRGVTETGALGPIVEEVKAAGFVPSVHGDDHAEPAGMGCGYFKLWKTGKLEGLGAPGFDSEAGKAAVLEAGGVYEQLTGSHSESEVVINLVANTTLEPTPNNQRFVVDGWVLGKFNLDVGTYLTLAASTVEQLSETCRSARIVVE